MSSPTYTLDVQRSSFLDAHDYARPFPRTDAASGSFSRSCWWRPAVVAMPAPARAPGNSRSTLPGPRPTAALARPHGLESSARSVPKARRRRSPVILSFDCLGDNAISTIMTDQALRQGTAQARLTVDADSPRRIPGFAGTTSSGGQLVLTIPQDSMLVLLSGHQRAVIEYADGADPPRLIAEFPSPASRSTANPSRRCVLKPRAR